MGPPSAFDPQSLVLGAVLVRGRSGGGEPTLVDASPVQSEGIEIVGVQLEALARLEKRTGNLAGIEPEQSSALLQRSLDQAADVGGDGFELLGGTWSAHGRIGGRLMESEAAIYALGRGIENEKFALPLPGNPL